MHPVLRKGDADEDEETNAVASCVGGHCESGGHCTSGGGGGHCKSGGGHCESGGRCTSGRWRSHCTSGGGPLYKWRRATAQVAEGHCFKWCALGSQAGTFDAPSRHSAERACRDSTGSPNTGSPNEYGLALMARPIRVRPTASIPSAPLARHRSPAAPARHRSPAEPAPRDSQEKNSRIASFNPVVTPGLRGTPRGTLRGQQPKNGWCLFPVPKSTSATCAFEHHIPARHRSPAAPPVVAALLPKIPWCGPGAGSKTEAAEPASLQDRSRGAGLAFKVTHGL